jgi:hypothetical protein
MQRKRRAPARAKILRMRAKLSPKTVCASMAVMQWLLLFLILSLQTFQKPRKIYERNQRTTFFPFFLFDF